MKKECLERASYPTDLTDSQWAVIEPLFVEMRQYKYSKRELLNAVLYVVDSGCKWRQLPHDFPAWQTVYSFFRRANEKGLWDKILEHLIKIIRKKAGRNPNPSYALIDSQSVKTAYASEQTGFDGEKNKRQKTTYSYRYSRLLALKVHKANLHDTKACMFIAIQTRRKYPQSKNFVVTAVIAVLLSQT